MSSLSFLPVIPFTQIFLESSASLMECFLLAHTRAEQVTKMLPFTSQAIVLRSI